MRTAALLTIAAVLFYAGTMYGSVRTLKRERSQSMAVAEKHGERDAWEQAQCAVAVVAWEGWRDRATRAVEAQYGPFNLTEGE